jgi:hypothetical protein
MKIANKNICELWTHANIFGKEYVGGCGIDEIGEQFDIYFDNKEEVELIIKLLNNLLNIYKKEEETNA